MKRFIGLLLAFAVHGSAFGEGVKVEELQDAPPLTATSAQTKKEAETPAAPLLAVGLRADVSFSAGRPTDQGFSMPGLRLNFSGEIARAVDYKVSLAPSREFSSVLIPQILPVDAWLQIHNGAHDAWNSEPSLIWKVGMFAPTSSPNYSSDLADLPIPDYAKTHQATLLFRELGTELTVHPVGGIALTGGIFNGSGIIALNTNNSKALTGAALGRFELGGDTSLHFGISGYSSRQSDSGSVNFISNGIGNGFVTLRLGEHTQLGIDIVTGKLQDASRSVSVFGFTGTAVVGLSSWLKAYFRGEALRYAPLTEPRMNRVQLGPILEPLKNLRLFVFAEHTDDSTGATENAFQCLMRLTL